MRVVPLGERALIAYAPDEATVVRLAAALRAAAPPWLVDLVPSYTTLGIYFNPRLTTAAVVPEFLRTLSLRGIPQEPGPVHSIPVCYERGPDLTAIATALDLA
ncbi:MAG: carboxyltransferase domain-containing protein, partial [Gemmataceae bacterium]